MHKEIKEFFTPVLSEYHVEKTVLVDATVGFGGHSDALLSLYLSLCSSLGEETQSEKLRVAKNNPQDIEIHAIDADRHMLDMAKKRLHIYGDIVHYHNTFFDQFFLEWKNSTVDGILMDLGVSMYHFKEANRGFSRNDQGLLDMRLSLDMDYSASHLINESSADELIRIFYEYGEEKQAVKWVNRIVMARKHQRIETATDLCDVLQLGKKSMDRPILARIFQAIRIAVNDELGRLERSLPLAWKSLKKDGIMAVISFHSLEDRIVKNFFKHVAGRLKHTQNIPIYSMELCDTAHILTKKPIVPGAQELSENIASRSAKLRVVKKIV